MAERLALRLREDGFDVQARSTRMVSPQWWVALGMVAAIVALWIAFGTSARLLGLGMMGLGLVASTIERLRPHMLRLSLPRKREPLLQLAAAPVALPAAEPLVRRLAGLLDAHTAPELRELVAELALAAQRLAERRALLPAARAETELRLLPADALVERLARELDALRTLDGELASIDEGRLVRALFASEARGEAARAREPLLTALDRLRTLEDARAAHMARLLEAASLLRETLGLALSTPAPDDEYERRVQLAMAVLDAELDSWREPWQRHHRAPHRALGHRHRSLPEPGRRRRGPRLRVRADQLVQGLCDAPVERQVFAQAGGYDTFFVHAENLAGVGDLSAAAVEY